MSVRPIHLAPICPLLALLVSAPAWSAWPHDGFAHLQVAPISGDQFMGSTLPDEQGGAFIAFMDHRSGNHDIYVQRVTASGTIAPGWPATGFAICTAAGDQGNPVAVSDGAGGLVVAWEDARAGASNRDMFAQRVLSTAAVAPGWPANGRQLGSLVKDEFVPVICSDGARGAFVAWNLEFTPGTDIDVYAAHVDSTGALIWSSAIAAPLQDQTSPAIASDGVGGVIVAYDDNASGDSDIKAVRRNGAGVNVYGPLAVCSTVGAQFGPAITGDGQGGAIVAWPDIRFGGHYDIFAMGLTPAGAAAPFYNASGNSICSAPQSQFMVQVTSDGNHGAYIAWRDERNFDWDLFVQHVLPIGAIAPGWPVDGIPLCTKPGEQWLEALVPDRLGGVVASWEDSRSSGGPRGIYASRVLPTGALAPGWTSDGTLLGVAFDNFVDPRACADAAGNVIVSWSEKRGVNYNILAQRVEVFGQLGNPEPAITRVRDVLADQGGRVRIDWNASYLDVNPTFGADHYWIWRQAPAAQAQLAARRGARLVGLADLDGLARPTPAEWSAITEHGLYLDRGAETNAYVWEYVAEVEASGFPAYSYVAATTTDSTGAHNYYTPFMVQARGSGVTFWSSAPDSGYSVDNLPPVAPAPFFGVYGSGSTALHWGPNAEADFASYRLHRGSSAGFVPGPGNLVTDQPDTGYVDAGPAGSYYKLAAVDAHGNVSAYALVTPQGTVSVAPRLPSVMSLGTSQPNPAVTGCLIPFALPRDATVAIDVFDIGGRRIRQLQRGALPAGEHAVRWDTRDGSGHRVGGGLYVVRMSAEGRTLTSRVLVTR